MINIEFTHTSNHGASAKHFSFTGTEGMVIEQKVPNQAKQLIKYADALYEQNEEEFFTLTQLADFIDDNIEQFTTSKGGTIRIVRYYSKLLQECGILTAV